MFIIGVENLRMDGFKLFARHNLKIKFWIEPEFYKMLKFVFFQILVKNKWPWIHM